MAKKKTPKFYKHLVFILSVWIAYLIKDFALYVMGGPSAKKITQNPYVATLIGMTLIVIIFYPVYEGLKKSSKVFLEGYFKRSEEIAKSKILGIFLGFVFMFIILFGVFAYVWHNKNLISDFQYGVGIKG